MRCVVVALAALLGSSALAEAKIAITVDKDNQQMTVAVDGVTKYLWPVSSGDPRHETPNGSFRTFRMEEDHYSKEFDDAPMPHAIFFTKQGHAIHGTDSVSRLGSPASHGCVRLSRANATTLYAMVQADGVLNTTVTLTGSAQIALANNPRPGKQIARRDPLNDVASPGYDATGNPTETAPVQTRPIYPRRVLPQITDNGYIYPADGSGGRYPAPRGYRRDDDAQGNSYSGYGGQPSDTGQRYAPQIYAPRGYVQRSYGYQDY